MSSRSDGVSGISANGLIAGRLELEAERSTGVSQSHLVSRSTGTTSGLDVRSIDLGAVLVLSVLL